MSRLILERPGGLILAEKTAEVDRACYAPGIAHGILDNKDRFLIAGAVAGYAPFSSGDAMLSESDQLECSTAVTPINGVLELLLRFILGGLAVAIVVGAVLLMLNMNESWRSHGGRYLVAVGAFVLLIGVDTQLARLAWRRFIAGLTPAKGYQRRSSRATLALVFAAVFLFSQALLLP